MSLGSWKNGLLDKETTMVKEAGQKMGVRSLFNVGTKGQIEKTPIFRREVG
jgi:hypothetical protein